MKRILVTGATGFVGQRLVKKLIEKKFLITCAVRNKNKLLSEENINLYFFDSINSNTEWKTALKGIDIVIHLAAKVHEMNDRKDSISEYQEINVNGTENLLRQAVQAKVKKFIFLSSIKVNGEGYSSEQTEKKYDENDIPNPQDYYSKSKLAAEKKVIELSKGKSLNYVIIRPPLVYGPEVKANFLQLFNAVNKGIPLPFGSILNLRSYIYVENLVDAILACAFHSKADNQIFLVSDEEVISTPELIRQIALSLNIKPRLFLFPIFLLDFLGLISGKKEKIDRLSESLVLDISKIKNLLNWKPPFSMKEGLKQTAFWFQNRT